MTSPLDMLLNAVKSSIGAHAEQQGHTGFDPSALVSEISGLFGKHQEQHGSGRVVPASQDPYGDPGAALGAQNVKPASADPYGDPADQAGRGR